MTVDHVAFEWAGSKKKSVFACIRNSVSEAVGGVFSVFLFPSEASVLR